MSIVRGMGAKVAAGGVLAMLALSGCSATESPAPGASPRSPTTTPLFANEQEALAAATKAYEAYLMVSDLILTEGGRGGYRINRVASQELARSEIEGYEMAMSKKWHGEGRSAFRNLTIQSINSEGTEGKAVVTAYLCSDLTHLDIVDSRGNSVSPKRRRSETPMEVTFDLSSTGSGELIVGARNVWLGENVC